MLLFLFTYMALLMPCILCYGFVQPKPTFGGHSFAGGLLKLNGVSVSTPSSEKASEMGVREWPQQLKKGTWQESSKEGGTLVRYVLDGTGSLEVSENGSPNRKISLSPGTLLEVSGDVSLSWTAKNEMIILTPGFEEGGTLAIVAVGVLVIFGALLAGVGS